MNFVKQKLEILFYVLPATPTILCTTGVLKMFFVLLPNFVLFYFFLKSFFLPSPKKKIHSIGSLKLS